jgi:hypothetical protein
MCTASTARSAATTPRSYLDGEQSSDGTVLWSLYVHVEDRRICGMSRTRCSAARHFLGDSDRRASPAGAVGPLAVAGLPVNRI